MLVLQVLIGLQDALAAYVSTQRAHYACNPSVTWRAMEDPLKMRLAVGVTYTFTGKCQASVCISSKSAPQLACTTGVCLWPIGGNACQHNATALSSTHWRQLVFNPKN